MKVKWKKLWIKALLSGKYKQTHQNLHDTDGYCCLGVLCRVVSPNTKWEDDIQNDGNYTFKGEGLMPPRDLLKDIGLSYQSAKALARMNDNGKSFEQIAKRIKAKY